MTDHILQALGGTDERYFLAYAETMKEKNPKKIVLRRWLSAAVAVIAVVGVVFALTPVRRALSEKNNDLGVVFRFASSEAMMMAGDAGYMASASADGQPQFPYGTRLSLLDFDRFDGTKYYICWQNRGPSDFSLAMGGPATYVCDFEKDGVRYEIAYMESVNSLEIPDHFRTETKYRNAFSTMGIAVSYEVFSDRAECEFTEKGGYYKIICHAGEEALFAILEDLLQVDFERGYPQP
ncbi:MAG: hypothetical protein IJK98_10285 [Clostridia bacterium]|nr:hypothetical protein [Clostridia bacterium]